MNATVKADLREFVAIGRRLKSGCGTGAGGFQHGNTCGRGGGSNSPEGGTRRRAAAKRRRPGGPNSSADRLSGARRHRMSLRARRRLRGDRRKARRKYEARHRGPAHRELQAAHRSERRDLAHEIRAERGELRGSLAKPRKELAGSIRKERAATWKAQAKEAGALKKTQAKAKEKLEATHAKAKEKLAAKHAAERADPRFAGKQNALRERQARQQARLEKVQAREQRQLRRDHREARDDLRNEHREARQQEREGHRDEIEAHRDLEREDRDSLYQSHLERVRDLETEHRAARAELLRDRRGSARELRRERGGKGLEWETGDGIPTADAILASALTETGHADGWDAGTLGGRQHLDVLHAVRLEARRWLRAEAAAVLVELDGYTDKALFGAARAAVGRFFERAGKVIREAIVAGVLAISGPDPAVLDDPVIQEAVERQVNVQAAYLETFHRQIVDEAKPLDGTFVSRAEMYGAASYSAAIEVQRQQVIAADVRKQERRVLGPKDHCEDCPPLAELDWQPIGTLPPIGQTWDGEPTECRIYCGCYFEFR